LRRRRPKNARASRKNKRGNCLRNANRVRLRPATILYTAFAGVCRKQQRECSKTLYERRVQTTRPNAETIRRSPRLQDDKSAGGMYPLKFTDAVIILTVYGAASGSRDLEAATGFRPLAELSPTHLSFDSKRTAEVARYGKKRRDSACRRSIINF